MYFSHKDQINIFIALFAPCWNTSGIEKNLSPKASYSQPLKTFEKHLIMSNFTVNYNEKVNVCVKIRYLVEDFLFDAVSEAVVNIVFAWLSVQIKYLMLGQCYFLKNGCKMCHTFAIGLTLQSVWRNYVKEVEFLSCSTFVY